MNITTT